RLQDGRHRLAAVEALPVQHRAVQHHGQAQPAPQRRPQRRADLPRRPAELRGRERRPLQRQPNTDTFGFSQPAPTHDPDGHYPVTNYRDRGFGFLDRLVNQRAVASASGTYFVKLYGLHAFKLGGDMEYNYFQDFRSFTGGPNGGSFTTFEAGGPFVERTQFGQ